MNDGGHQAHDHTPSRGVYASSYVPRHQNNDVVLPVPPQGLLCQDSTNASNSYTLQSMVAFPTAIHKCDTVIDVTDLRQFNDRSLLFDIRKVTPATIAQRYRFRGCTRSGHDDTRLSPSSNTGSTTGNFI